MIKSINFIATDDVLIEVEMENSKATINFSDISPYWCYATEEDFEGGFANIVDDKILFSLATASFQGGIIAIWDSKTQKIEHISEGAYCVAADISEGKIYRLLCVSNFVTKAHFELWETPIGLMDSTEEGAQINLDMNDIVDKFDGSYSSVKLKASQGTFSITIKNEEFLFPKN